MWFPLGNTVARRAAIIGARQPAALVALGIPKGGAFCSVTSPRILAPPMVYISGEEMSRYTMQLVLDRWVQPHVDMSQWEFYDLSCTSRDETLDSVLEDAVEAGARIGAIFKEPTITPSKEQALALGLTKAWGSPNGKMRRGWRGISISRDTIHLPGIELGFKRPVLVDRHAVGGEYGAGWKKVGKGRILTTFFPEDMDDKPIIIDGRKTTDRRSAVVVYDNPLDNVEDLAHIFFTRCLESRVVPYVVTKKTVFKWQEGFWQILSSVFERDYRSKFLDAGLLPGGELRHLISDAATMQIIRWTGGGFGMACHNYDGDMLTDEVAQVHRSPGFVSSVLTGRREDGRLIKEYEASHGTVADLWRAHQRGEETSMNPLGMVVALLGAMRHAASLAPGPQDEILRFTDCCRAAVDAAFIEGRGTRDMAGPAGLTTEQFVDSVGADLTDRLGGKNQASASPAEGEAWKVPRSFRRNYKVQEAQMRKFFERFDKDGNGQISFEEFLDMALELGIAPSSEIDDDMKHAEEKVDREAPRRIRRWGSLAEPQLFFCS